MVRAWWHLEGEAFIVPDRRHHPSVSVVFARLVCGKYKIDVV